MFADSFNKSLVGKVCIFCRCSSRFLATKRFPHFCSTTFQALSFLANRDFPRSTETYAQVNSRLAKNDKVLKVREIEQM